MRRLLVPIVAVAAFGCARASVNCLGADETVDGINVPRIGTVGDFPYPALRLVVNVTDAGRIVVGDRNLTFAALGDELSRLDPNPRPRAGTFEVSAIHVVLRLDGDLPWAATQMLLLSCAEHAVDKIVFAVRHETEGGEGGLALFLPHDHGVQNACDGDDSWVVRRVKVIPDPSASSPASLYRELSASPAVARSRLGVLIDADARVRTGTVIALMDASLRAEATSVDFACGRQVSWTEAIATSTSGRGFALRIDGSLLPDAESAAGMPATDRVLGRLAGITQPPSLERAPEEEAPEITERSAEPR